LILALTSITVQLKEISMRKYIDLRLDRYRGLNSWANQCPIHSSAIGISLIHATVEQLQRINFPAGDGVQIGGWDGIVYTEQGNAFCSKAVQLGVWNY